MVKNEARENLVRSLIAVARACGVQVGLRGDAGRPKVEAMMAAIRNSSGPLTSKTSAEGTYKAWEATFIKEGEPASVVPSSSQGQAEEASGSRLRGKSFLSTYN